MGFTDLRTLHSKRSPLVPWLDVRGRFDMVATSIGIWSAGVRKFQRTRRAEDDCANRCCARLAAPDRASERNSMQDLVIRNKQT